MSFLASAKIFLASLLIAAASWIHPVAPATPPIANLGSFTPVQAQKFKLSGSGITSSAASITLQTFKLPDASTTILMSDLGSVAYGTLEPGTTKEEQISFTGVTQNANGTATLTGVTRGLDFRSSVCTAVSANQKSHAGGTIFILSNTACFYSEFDVSKNDETIIGMWTFATSAIPRLGAQYSYTTGDETKFVTYGQLASTSFSGTVNSSYTQKGLVQMATTSEIIAGTQLGSTGAYLSLPAKFANQTSSAANLIPVTNTSGKLSSGFIDQTANYSWSGSQAFSSTTSISGTFSATGSSTLASTTFSITPFLPSTAPTLGRQATNKTYVDTVGSLYLNDNAFVDNGSGSVATSTFTLSNAGRVMVILRGSTQNSTGGDGCAFTLFVDGVMPSDWATTTITSAVGNNRQSIGTTYITASLSAALHNIQASSSIVTGGTCATAGIGRLTTEYIGQ